MPFFRNRRAFARTRARFASARSRRWGWPRRGIVTARSLLRYRSKRRFPTITYRGPSREVKIKDSSVKYVLGLSDEVGGGVRFRVAQNTYRIEDCRPTSISAGSGATERIGNVIQTKSLTVHMLFQALGYLGSGERPADHLDANHFRRTHWRWALVEDLTMPPTDDPIPAFSFIYETSGPVSSPHPNEDPLLAQRNVAYMGRYNVLRQGDVVVDSDDPIKAKKIHVPFVRNIRYEGGEADANATSNVYLVMAAYSPFLNLTPPSAGVLVVPECNTTIRCRFSG